MAAKKSSKEVRAEQAMRDMLKAIVERIERLEDEKKDVGDSIREVYDEAKAGGFDPRVIRAVIKLRKTDEAERNAHQDMLDNYLHALGMLAA